MTRFRICTGCSRHVMSMEQTCPFCLTSLEPVAVTAVPKLASGLSRAQRMAVAAAAAVAGQALTDCTTSPTGSVIIPIYGAPIAGAPAGSGASGKSGSSGTGVSGTSGGSAGQIAIPVYGAPIAGQPSTAGHPAPSKDAGAAGSSGAAGEGDDAGEPTPDAGHMVHPLYGAPVPLYGAPIPAYGLPPTPKR